MVTELKKHPTKEGCFIETARGLSRGKPLKKTGHIFNFTSKKIEVTSTFSSHRPITFTNKGSVIGDVKLASSEAIFLELETDCVYSCIGTLDVVNRFTMWIDCLDNSDFNFPHIFLGIWNYEDGPNDPALGVGLYIEEDRLNKIKEDFFSDRFNFVNVKLTTSFDYDLIFTSSSVINYPSPYCIQSLGLDPKKYGKVITPYPYKLIPRTFHSYVEDIKPYKGEPITEFDITFGKRIGHSDVLADPDPNVQRIKDWMTYELLSSYECDDVSED